jgi:hypothetical protein
MKTREKGDAFPAVPDSSEREQSPSFTSKQYVCFVCQCASTIKRICGNQQLQDFNASRNAGLVFAVSGRALIILAAADGVFRA